MILNCVCQSWFSPLPILESKRLFLKVETPNVCGERPWSILKTLVSAQGSWASVELSIAWYGYTCCIHTVYPYIPCSHGQQKHRHPLFGTIGYLKIEKLQPSDWSHWLVSLVDSQPVSKLNATFSKNTLPFVTDNRCFIWSFLYHVWLVFSSNNQSASDYCTLMPLALKLWKSRMDVHHFFQQTKSKPHGLKNHGHGHGVSNGPS